MKSICRYYSNKFFKVIVPTFSFIFLCCVLIFPSFIKSNPIAVFKFLTFSYNGRPGVSGIGGTWYVFSLVPLYLLAPLFAFIANNAAKRSPALICLFASLIFAGFLYCYFATKFGIDWYNMIYTPFFANIDLFFGGICLNQIINSFKNKKFSNTLLKDFSLFAFLAFILVNSIFYEKYFFYQVFCPSIYLIIVAFCLYAFSDESWAKSYERPMEKAIAFFSGISFEFYLFHSLILHTILSAFGEPNAIVLHFKLLIIAFILTSIFAIGFKRIFEKREKIFDLNSNTQKSQKPEAKS